MRRRLLIVLLALSALAVAGFAWPLLVSTASARTQQFVITRTADLDRFAVLAQQASETGDHAALAAELRAYADLYGEPAVVVDARRRPVASAGPISASDPSVTPIIDGALRNQAGQPVPALRPWSAGSVLLARPVGAGTRVAGVVVLRASVAAAAADVTRQWALIGLGALAAAGLFGWLAIAVAGWLLRPLAELEAGVRAVTAGQRRTHVPASAGPEELRSLAQSFNTMSDAVAEAAEAEHRLVADASHQLRNPMAALRLRMDTLAGRVGADGRRAYRSAVAEVERLEALLDGLMALATADSAASRLTEGSTACCDAVLVCGERFDAWLPSAQRAGVTLERADGPEHLPLACPEPELAQVLDVLLDNAIKYAGTGARVQLRCDPAGAVVVSDDGPGLPETERAMATERFWRSGRHSADRGTGLGLSIADQVIAARGGRLTVSSTDPHGLTIHCVLPRAEVRT